MKNIFKFVCITIAICLVVMSLAGCRTNKRMPGLTSNMAETSSTSGVVDTSNDIVVSGPAFEGSFNVPKFKTGTYTMETYASRETSFDETAATVYSVSTSYYYTLNVTANSDGSASIKYTFDRLIASYYTPNDGTITSDTATENCISYHKDLMGKSFTAKVDASGNFSSISGVSEILASNENFAAKLGLSEESLKSVVKDTFYALPATINGETSFTLTQGTADAPVNIYYRAALLKDNRVAFSFKEQTEGLPETTINATAITSYRSYEPANGTLWISLADRALVEYSSYSQICYTAEYDSGTFDCTDIIRGSSKVTAK